MDNKSNVYEAPVAEVLLLGAESAVLAGSEGITGNRGDYGEAVKQDWE